MIIHNYECQSCGKIDEFYVESSDIPDRQTCRSCKGIAKKIFLPSQTTAVDAPWIAGVREVVDKNSDKPHIKEFLRHPTRANLKTYMEKENLRHMDRAETGFPKVDRKAEEIRVKKGMLERYRARNAVGYNE